MIDQLRSEWVKFRSVRSTVVTLVLAGALVVLVAVAVAASSRDDTATSCQPASNAGAAATTTVPTTVPAGDVGSGGFSVDGGPMICGEGQVAVEHPVTKNLTAITGGVSFAALLFGVLGVQVIGQEYRFNTIRPTFTAAPRRRRVLVAKVIVVALACAIVSLVMVAVCVLVGSTMLDRFEIDAVDQRLFWAIPLFAALWSMAGVGLGAIVRQPIAAILILLGESLVAESLIGNIFDWTQPWLPFTNGFQMTLRLTESENGGLRSTLGGGIYFALVCAVLFAIGALLAERRDA